MKRFERENLKVRIIRLADLKCTGSPAELGSRLEISERSVKRFVGEIRATGKNIRFCPVRRSYVTEKEY